MLKVIPFYAAILALLYVYLSARTIGFRRKSRVSIGDGGDQELLRAVRMHANYAEYVPISLILLTFVELQAAPLLLVHVLGSLLLIARISHAYGISSVQAKGIFRVGGMAGTFTTITIAAMWLLNEFFMFSTA
jgi:uncharacterized membrane protein YecN with MAPEG domain